MSSALALKDLSAHVGNVTILKELDLEIPFGELHVIMGPNGSGKSTLCHALMGKPGYQVTGSATVAGSEVLGLPVDTRAQVGVAAAFQYPIGIPGVTLRELLDELAEQRADGAELAGRVTEAAERLGAGPFLDRAVNEGLSGGEKKRSEIFQLAVLQPKVAVLDEIDSGLDIDAVREVAEAVEAMRTPEIGVLLITHYNRILQYLTPDRIHVMINGEIVKSGGPELADELEDKGYAGMQAELGIEVEEEPAAEDGDFLAGL